MRRAALVVVVALAFAVPAASQGDVGLLSARVVDAEAAGDQAALLQVEVKSRSADLAEPLEFAVRIGTEEHRVRRVPQPEAGRRGRAVPRRGKQTYWLMVGTAARPRGWRGIDVEVTRAGFHGGPAVAECPVTIDGVRREDLSEGGVRFPASILTTTSGSDRPVDVLILAQLEKPERSRWLFPARVEPGAGRELTIGATRNGIDWEGRLGSTSGVSIVRAEVVDWTAVHVDTDAPIVREFAAAWRAWHRWEVPPAGTGGRFRLRQQSTQEGQGVTSSIRISGRFTIGGDGAAAIEVETVEGTADRRPPRAVFELAFRDLRRPSFDELAAAGVAAFDARRVHVPTSGPRLDPGDVFEVEDGRIVASTFADSPEVFRWTNVIDALGDGYVVTQRRCWQKALGEHITEQRSYATLPGGVVFPTRLARLESHGALFNEYELVLSELRAGVEVEADAPPAGPAADALRAVWDRAHAYPETRADVTARVAVTHRGTDGVWDGVRKVEGRLTLRGYRGFRMAGGSWEDCTFAVEADDLSPSARAALQNAVADRLGIWLGRDFVGRRPFDEVFRGATIREPVPGTFEIDGGGVDRLVAVDGIPREVRFVGGRHLFLEWRELGDALVLARVRSGGETLRATFRRFDGVVFPTEFRFERVFGDDWGPETLTFSDVRIERRG